jgi:hypothetical protein
MSGSNDITLREHFERVIAEHDKALMLYREMLEARLETLNHLRGDVITKSEYNRAHEAMMERMIRMEAIQSKMIGIGIGLMFASGLLGYAIAHFSK